MVFDRPKRPGQPQHKPLPATDRPKEIATQTNLSKPKKIITVGGSGGNRGTGGNGGGNDSNRQPNNQSAEPSPWLNPDNEPNPAATASFVEYLRWMRSPDSDYKDATKVQLLQIAEERASYRDRLTQLTKRTKLIAGEENTFQVKCPWRIRVGGHRGPESILLPAFDALGMPYIPSSTLRGVARCQAIRSIMAEDNLGWRDAEQQIAPYFGALDAENRSDRTGKVIFLDAYPLPCSNQSGGLAVDMANSIWSWENDTLNYGPNPNPFFSLNQPTFVIGVRPTLSCDSAIFEQIKQWLIVGLQAGAGSQINTGYGSLTTTETATTAEFFRVKFTLQGQLIHGRQRFTQWRWNDQRQEWQMRGQPDAEVRPTAFKSMLRYWFRAFALGVMLPSQVKTWEATLFGAINPQKRGWIRVQILEGKVRREPRPNEQGRNDPCGQQEGILTLAYSPEVPENSRDAIAQLFKNLAWLMFRLGGIGQGARRPCYSRRQRSRQRAPWYRGSTFPEREDSFWSLPATPERFKDLFQQRLQDFYRALSRVTDSSINPRSPKTVNRVSVQHWVEAVDAHCRIIVCSGEEDFDKPYALAVLHSSDLKVEDRQGRLDYDGNLCGKVGVGKEVKPSPVWIADLGNYQVVTVFGATQNPRKNYLKTLRDRTTPQNYVQILPLI